MTVTGYLFWFFLALGMIGGVLYLLDTALNTFFGKGKHGTHDQD